MKRADSVAVYDGDASAERKRETFPDSNLLVAIYGLDKHEREWRKQ